MKLKYLIYTITLTSLTACSDFLEPKSQSKYIPKDANALQEMLIGEAYPQQGNTKFLAYLEILADDIDQNQVEGYEFPENEQGKMETFEVLYSWQPNMFEMQQKLGQEPSNTWGNLYEYILEPMLHLIILTKCPVQKLKKLHQGTILCFEGFLLLYAG